MKQWGPPGFVCSLPGPSPSLKAQIRMTLKPAALMDCNVFWTYSRSP